MNLRLDARQRAMLAEMGGRLPDAPARVPATAATVRTPAAQADAPAAAAGAAEAAGVPVRRPDPAPAPPSAAPPHAAVRMAPGRVVDPGADLATLDWAALQAHVAGCQACGLCATRRNAVFGAGDPRAGWLVVGEFPSEEEDLQGEPFVGEPGRLLDNMLRAAGVSREQGAYLTLALKCRPPPHAQVGATELAHCEAILRRQVDLLKPRVIVAMGRMALQVLVGGTEPLGRLRGRAHAWEGVPVVATYHPAYLLRNPADKAKAWADLCLAMELAEAA